MLDMMQKERKLSKLICFLAKEARIFAFFAYFFAKNSTFFNKFRKKFAKWKKIVYNMIR